MHRIYVNPLPVRLWHWTNALGFLVLILTGLHIRYVGIFDLMSFKTAVTVHNWVGFVLIANYFVWFVFYLCTPQIRNYLPDFDARRLFTRAFRQVRYYGYGMFVGEKDPHVITPYDKFNPMQAMLYSVVMLIVVPIQFYTGLLLWDVKRFAAQVDFLGGVRIVDTVHVLIFAFFIVYIFMHAYLGALGRPWTSHYKAMFTGWEEEEGPDDEGAAEGASTSKHG